MRLLPGVFIVAYFGPAAAPFLPFGLLSAAAEAEAAAAAAEAEEGDAGAAADEAVREGILGP